MRQRKLEIFKLKELKIKQIGTDTLLSNLVVLDGPILQIYLILRSWYSSCFFSSNQICKLVKIWMKWISNSLIWGERYRTLVLVVVFITDLMEHLNNKTCKDKDKKVWLCINKDKWINNKVLECLKFSL